jgi:Cys-tRNA(Pro)/Cys-tRNA(Cys) deacylase
MLSRGRSGGSPGRLVAMSKHKGATHGEHASTPAVAALLKADVAHTLHTYNHDPHSDLSYGLEAAAALGVDAAQVFKTLCAYADGALVMGIVPVDGTLDLKALAHALGAKKAQMAPPEDAERATGYVVGGISPIGGRKRLPLVLDDTAQLFDQIYVSGGRRGFDIALAPGDLLALVDGVYGEIAKTRE